VPAPAPLVSQFLESYRVFAQAPETQIQAKLAAAAARTNAAAFLPEQVADAVMLRAAIALMRDPDARPLRKESPDQIKEWSKDLRALCRGAASIQRVF
jgi:hypothetical protein